MPKLKKPSKSSEGDRAAWRTPVKLPTTPSNEPIKSLYNQSGPIETISESEIKDSELNITDNGSDALTSNQAQETSGSVSKIKKHEAELKAPVAQQKLKTETTSKAASEAVHDEEIAPRPTEAEFLRLMKTEKMDFYSLAEILRGTSMALYCVLYSESLAKGESRCQIRQTDLMLRAGINNPATLYKQERWLTALGLISKSIRLGNHNGASYEVQPLEILPLPQFILAQFEGYLTEIIR